MGSIYRTAYHMLAISQNKTTNEYECEQGLSTDPSEFTDKISKKGRRPVSYVGFELSKITGIDLVLTSLTEMEQIAAEMNRGNIQESDLVALLQTKFEGKAQYLPKEPNGNISK